MVIAMIEAALKTADQISEQAIHAVVRQIVTKFRPEQVILFGSHAYGDAGPESDVDLLVVMDSPLRNVDQAIAIACALDYHFALDLMVRRPQQLAERIALGDFFLREVVEKGKVLYERSHA